MTRNIINVKINKVMTRKKRIQEEQPLTTEVVGAKKKSPKKKKAVEEKTVIVQEQEASVNEPIPKKKLRRILQRKESIPLTSLSIC